MYLSLLSFIIGLSDDFKPQRQVIFLRVFGQLVKLNYPLKGKRVVD